MTSATSEIVLHPPLDPPLLSVKKLAWILCTPRDDLQDIAKRAGSFYKPFDRRKTVGEGKWRHIDNPKGALKVIQRKIHKRLLCGIEFDEAYCGGVRGRSIRDNARFHLGKEVVVCLDIRQCFPSISNKAVFSAYRSQLHASEPVARILTQLTTFQHRLPQGAPTSSVLATLVLAPVFGAIRTIAEESGCVASIYVDDITISGARARECIGAVIREIQSAGLSVSNQKTKIMASGTRQMVTGLVVNRNGSYPRQRRDELRDRIIEVADSEKVMQRDLDSIWSTINFIRTINRRQSFALERLANRLLPVVGAQGTRHLRGEIRWCNDFMRNHDC